jgi:recombination protein RecA
MAKKKPKDKIIREVIPYYSKIDTLAESVAEVLGKDATYKASQSDRGAPRFFIPSGIKGMDKLLDRKGRGWPGGRIVECFGDEATAKSALGLSLIAQCQKMGGDGILWPCEGEYDEWLADKCGVDRNKLILGDSETVEGVFGSFSKSMRRVGRTGLMVGVIDSIASMSTEAEIAELETTGIIKRDRSAQIRALMLSSAIRKVAATIPRTNVILFCINQIRINPDVLFGSGKQPPGGKALKFHASIRLQLEPLGKYIRQKAGKKYVAGMKIKATVIKNRLARPYQEANMLLSYDDGLIPMPKGRKKKT